MSAPAQLSTTRLPRDWLASPADKVARRLLGTVLVRALPTGERLSGRIVETEAYLGARDRASHAFALRRTPRNEAMYAQPGTCYVYFTYGMHWCMNVVCAQVGVPEAVLLRAIEPLHDTPAILNRLAAAAARLRPHQLCSGPARLCRALQIDRALNGADLLTDNRLWLESPPRRSASLFVPHSRVRRTPRVGVESAGDWATKPLRFLETNNPHVSGRRI